MPIHLTRGLYTPPIFTSGLESVRKGILDSLLLSSQYWRWPLAKLEIGGKEKKLSKTQQRAQKYRRESQEAEDTQVSS